jgi:heme/copper-type cytochrome/quinol oxidase subunit 4
MNKEEKIFDNRFWKTIFLFGIVIIFIVFLPILFTIENTNSRYDFTTTGQIGDTIGGTITPFVAIAAALLTFIAFWVQYKANIKQTEQFKIQAEDTTIERFENKFYEAIRLHKENIKEIEISKTTLRGLIKGRKAFILMFFEFRYCYSQIKKFIKNNSKIKPGFDIKNEKIIIDIAYQIFFMGTGDNSDLIKKSLSELCAEEFIVSLIAFLEKDKEKSRDQKPPFELRLNFELPDNPNEQIYKVSYTPFAGHISRLGHYFRHLYQSVKFISEQDEKVINKEKKQEYAKILRAQLSDYEQLLLFYNINSTLGNAWVRGSVNFTKEYRMIKNMPVPLANFGIIPHEIFSKEINYWKTKNKSFFEWDERKHNS